ncbi:MAG: bifunctional UDP-N-acetylmuramoyl-tripeptide:D-alanyl-D-alanine ligase/alanine racemase [Candidatus Delongbacteria bacterium]|jgi:alanine racemase|nr:bifunctional UDP-N-acetylmuramoyl-tripeptide:D-alanyl-D-alanine ligase/alanine racemase [Candidatus Delongbacteria bacterium]
MKYSLKDIQNTCGGDLMGSCDTICDNILTDSRTIIQPQTSVFFAIPGLQYDGHDFIEDVCDAGVSNFVVQKLPVKKPNNTSFLVCDDVVACLQKLMADYRKRFSIPVIGITGSNGKTIVKEWFTQVMSKHRLVTRSPKSYNSQVGVPLSVSLLHNKTQIAVFEAGISMPGEMSSLEPVIQPDVVLLTNLGEAHQENFRDKTEKLLEKIKLTANANTLILGLDNPVVADYYEHIPENKQEKTVTWAFKNTQADYRVNYDRNKNGTFVELTGKDDLTFFIPFTDEASIDNAVNTALLLKEAGLDDAQIASGMKNLQPVAMRLEVKEGINNCTIINDSYNADINALRIALDFAVRQNNKPVVLILSDILQTGLDKASLYYQISELLNNTDDLHQVIGIGHDIRKHADKFDSNTEFFYSTDDFIDSGAWRKFKDQCILLKGARDFQFEKISKCIELKVHQTVLEIDLESITHNLKYFRSKVSKRTGLMVMVKAFSYGSGSIEIGRHLQNQAVDYLGVAIADEGVELRKAGVHIPIMVMNPQPEDFGLMYDYQLEPEIYSLPLLKSLIAHIRNTGLTTIGIHLKLDTGMHRLGFCEKDIKSLITMLKEAPEITVKSVFSHLAGSDIRGFDDFTRQQLDSFHGIYETLNKALKLNCIRHIANTNAILRFPETHLDMVRLGIGLYGLSAEPNPDLKKTTVFKTRVISVKRLKKGETIGYNRTGVLHQDADIAVLPVGYADGLNRKLGNGNWNVEINHQLYPIIGDVCMDMCMVNVTGAGIKPGNEVIIFGGQNKIEDMAESLHTIAYEILTSISTRVKRIYTSA